MNTAKLMVAAGLVASLAACNREPRSMIYFEKHLDEARELAADTKTCLGLDQTKVLTGTDECTNAHLAIRKAEAAAYEAEQKRRNEESLRSGSFMPRLKSN